MSGPHIWRANGCRYELGAGYQSVTLPMKATGKARPRVTVKGTFMPPNYQQARRTLRTLFGTVTIKMPCSMKMTVIRKIPASWSKKDRAETVWTFCSTKPDADNLLGWAMDALFDDDAAVVWVECVKVWGPRDLVHIELWEVNANERAIDGHELLAGLE